LKKYGLVSSMVYSAGTIPVGWNRKEDHDRLEKEMQAGIAKAAAAKLPNVVTFSGNRRGMSDEEGKANCVEGLKRVKKYAEDAGVTINVELLNSKVNHKDYMCDHTAWGVELVKAVGSPRVKLLYDIYHMQIMEGDVIRTIRDNIQYIGHFHTGGVPGRHELDSTQEIHWRTVAQAIADPSSKATSRTSSCRCATRSRPSNRHSPCARCSFDGPAALCTHRNWYLNGEKAFAVDQ
jgi:hydroxypyruvate isomerase